MNKKDLDNNIMHLLEVFSIEDTCIMLSSLFHCEDSNCPIIHFCDKFFNDRNKLLSCEEVIKKYIKNNVKGVK